MPTNLMENVLVIFCKDIIPSYNFSTCFSVLKKTHTFSNNFVILKYLSLYTVFWAGILESHYFIQLHLTDVHAIIVFLKG